MTMEWHRTDLGSLSRERKHLNIQLNFNGSNTFGTTKICSRRGLFELMSVNHSTRPGGIIGIFFNFLSYEGMLCVLIRIASSRRFY